VKHQFLSAAVALSVFLGGVATAPAMYSNLTEEQKLEAINYGSTNSQADPTDFLGEWAVVLDHDKGVAIMITEFLALASAAKEAISNGTALSQFDIEDAIARSKDKLVFRVTTFGPTMNFAKNYTAVVKTPTKTVATTYWNNSEGEGFGDGKTRPRFIADSDFYFPSEGIDPNGKITLIIKDQQGNVVTQFDFDLSKRR
jgi:hypothetical protein